MPLVVDVMSRTELRSGVVVLTPTLWACDEAEPKAKTQAKAKAEGEANALAKYAVLKFILIDSIE